MLLQDLFCESVHSSLDLALGEGPFIHQVTFNEHRGDAQLLFQGPADFQAGQVNGPAGNQVGQNSPGNFVFPALLRRAGIVVDMVEPIVRVLRAISSRGSLGLRGGQGWGL